MAVQCNPQIRFGAQDDVDLDGVGTVPQNLTENDRTGPVLKSTTTPPVTKVLSTVVTLSGGAATLDLSAVPYNGANVDLTGLKIQVMRLKNGSSNAITMSEGASNGYAFNGGNDVVIAAGEEIIRVSNETNPDVGASDETLDFAGTGTDSIIVEIAAG